MANYTTNLVQNPSFENDLNFYASINSTLTQTPNSALFGNYSMQVSFDGTVTGQGFQLTPITATAGQTYSFSLYLQATGSNIPVAVVVATNPGGIILGQTNITVGSAWTRYMVQGVTAPTGATQIYAYVVMTAPTVGGIYVDAVQLEPKSTTTQYCDGDQYGCYWTGTRGESSSYRIVQFPLLASGSGTSVGSMGSYSPQVPVQASPYSGVGHSVGNLTVSSVNPQNCFDNFAIYQLTDPDPAMSYVVASNAGTTDAAQSSSTWTRHWVLAVPPTATTASGGRVLWKQAAYAAVGFHFVNMAANDTHYIDDVQLEVYPVNLSTIAPTTYTTPRAITTTAKPTRMNHAPNPSFESSANNWTFHGTTTGGYGITQDSSITALFGTHSGKVFASNDHASYAYTTPTTLIAGRQYTFSCYLYFDPANFSSITLTANLAKQSVFTTAFANPWPRNTWTRIWMTFTAVQYQENLQLIPNFATGISSASFWVDGVLLEEGSNLNPYFDGSFGYDYLWETGGTAGETRSYYYQGRRYKTYLVGEMIQQNTPVGISSLTPQFSIPYLQ